MPTLASKLYCNMYYCMVILSGLLVFNVQIERKTKMEI